MTNLRNGFTIRLERHEARGEVTRLFLTETSDNYVDVSTAKILGYKKMILLLNPVFLIQPAAAHFNPASSLEQKGNREEAAKEFAEAARLNPKFRLPGTRAGAGKLQEPAEKFVE